MATDILRLLGLRGSDTRQYRTGKQVRTFAAGLRLVEIDGRNQLSHPVTDEPIRAGSQVTVVTGGRRAVLLGARK